MKEPRRCTQQPPERVNADETLIQSSSATKGAVAPPSPSSVLPPGDVVLGIAAIVGKAAFFLVGSTFLGLRASPRFFRWASKLHARGVLLAVGAPPVTGVHEVR